jgi:D-glycero-D-manno-heptose 1,7-bisphosphate phosphatase
MNKCIFLDRDGVLNVERGDYTFLPEDFIIEKGVPEAIRKIKEAGYLAIVLTNQAGITKGLYTREQMNVLHDILMEKTGFLIDRIYYCPYHSSITESLSRKPDTLMIEKAIARFQIDPSLSWIVGDRDRDIECGQRMGLRTVLIENIEPCSSSPTFRADNLLDAVNKILDFSTSVSKANESSIS